MSESAAPAATFRPSGLVLRGAGRLALVSLALDGQPVPVAARAVPGGLDVPLPPAARDGEAHRVEAVVLQDGAEHLLRGAVRSSYASNLDRIEAEVVGWIYDTAEPERGVVLDLEVDGQVVGQVRTGLERADVAASGHAAPRPGFAAPLPPARSATRPRLVVPRIAGTGHAPFGSFLTGVSAASYATLPPAPPPGPQALLRDRVATPALLGIARGTMKPPREVPTGTVRLSGPAWRRADRPVVDVVIPVYRGLEETLDCIGSVIAGQGAIAAEIVVIDDRSPEPALSAALQAMGDEGRITYLPNERNLGFVGTVNRGMRRSPRRDVVLLNSDTVVPPGWLDRLYDAAYSDPAIASATALSNNATICSLPCIGGVEGIPYGATLAQVDAACARANGGVTVDLPTAHGFCMFIKRAALDDVGVFDEVAFTRGYGEENDFSLRAATRGWRNVAACDVFVQHKGSVSFQGDATGLTQKNLKIIAASYPDYHRQVMAFIREDPLHAARNRVQMEFWRDRRIVVLATLAIGGGVGRHVEDAAASLAATGALVLVLSRAEPRDRHAYRLRAWGRPGEELLYPAVPDAAARAVADLIALAPDFVHVHHLLDTEAEMAELIAGSGLPYQVTLHDYFYACPRVTLLDESHRHCGLPEPSKCDRCIARGGAHPMLDPSFGPLTAEVARWRAAWRGFLAGASRRIAPSADTAALYLRAFPELSVEVWPHEEPSPPQVTPEARPEPARTEVVVLGAIGQHKGLDRLLDLLRHAERWAEDVHFTVLGFTSAEEQVARFANVTVTGPYEPTELGERLDALGAQVALFLSPWPETYSYTLSEALAHGLTPLAYDIGAIAERLRGLGCGFLRALDAPAPVMLEAIREAAAQRTPAIAFAPRPAPLLPSAAERGPPAPVALLRAGRGCFPDGWATRRVEWLLRLARPADGAGLEFWMPADFAGQFVTVSLEGRPVARRKLAPDGITTISLPGGLPAGLVALACDFDFDVQLPSLDQRRAAAVLRALTLRLDGTEIAWQPGPQPAFVAAHAA
jgi:GT2 family glycosyltransferase/glycosyltransferase involved in cell wall biosynthesis